MKEGRNFWNDYYNALSPAIYQCEYISWNELKQKNYDSSFVLYGTEISCRLMLLRFDQYNIKVKGLFIVDKAEKLNYINDRPVYPRKEWKHYSEGSLVIITYQDFPGNEEKFHSVKKDLSKEKIRDYYVIREFSAGFVLGVKELLNQRKKVEYCLDILADEESKRCYKSYLRHICRPYHWNMDMKEGNFGIADSKRYYNDEWSFFSYPNIFLANKALIYCCSSEWSDKDPQLGFCAKAKKTIFLYPNSVDRLKLREFVRQYDEELLIRIAILDKKLSNENGRLLHRKYMFSGGTPLEYEFQIMEKEAISVDQIRMNLGTLPIGLIVLDMREDFISAINGAKKTIDTDDPLIAVNGFFSAEQLWNSVILLKEKFPQKQILLRRYESENVLMGHVILIK